MAKAKKPAPSTENDPIEKSRRSIAWFVSHYFTDLIIDIHLDLTENEKGERGLHRDILEDLQELVEAGYNGWDSPDDALWRFIIAPREFCKSTQVRFLYLWLFAFPEKLRVPWIINLSRDRDKARKNLEYVKDLMLAHPDYCSDFGFVPGPRGDFENWNIDVLKSTAGKNALGQERGPMLLEVFGMRGIRGMHPGLVMVDDPEETEDVQNPDVLKKAKETFARDVMASITMKRPMGLVGTMLSEDALVTSVARGPNCRKGEPLHGWRGKEYDAIRPDGKAQWPAGWPLTLLDATRQAMDALSEGSFAFEFMNDPKGFKNNVWPVLWWPVDTPPPSECALGLYNEDRWEAAEGVWHLTAIDPATKTEEKNDYSACVTAAIVMDKESEWYGHAWIVNDWRAKLTPYELMQRMHEQCDRYPGIIGVEASHGDVFASLLRHERQHKKVPTRIESLRPWGSKKEDRARNGNWLVQSKRIHLCPWVSQEFRKEINKYPFNRPKHDDYCDALAYLQQLVIQHVSSRNPVMIKKAMTYIQRLNYELLHGKERKDMPPVGRSNLPC